MKIFDHYILLFISGLTIVCMMACEQSRTIPFEPTEYEPHLMIFGSAGPNTGARVILSYNRPFEGMRGVVPPIPELEVVIEGRKGEEFVLREDSAGYFSLPAEELELLPEIEYYLKVENKESQKIYRSSKVVLPEQPKIRELSADGSMSERMILLKVTLGEPTALISGISYQFYRLDSLENNLDSRNPFAKVRPTYYFFTGEDKWTSLGLIEWVDNSTWNEEVGVIRVNYIDAEVIYLSEELARFFFELRESYFFGEDIFQPVRQVYSNISGNHGIFGLFNETTARIELE